MTLRFAEGLDDITSNADAALVGFYVNSVGYPSTSGRFGGRCLDLTAGNNGQLGIPLAGVISSDTIIIGCAIKLSEQPAQTSYFMTLVRGTTSFGMGIGSITCFALQTTNGSNNVQLYNAAGTAVGSPFALTSGVWHWLDISCKSLNGTSGILTIKVDGVTVINALAGNFAGSSATGSNWAVCFQNRVTDTYIDDPIVCDDAGSVNNALFGDHKIITKRPNGISSAGSWTANTGSLNTAVAEAGANDGDTSYDGTSTLADSYQLTAAALGVTATSIMGVKHRVIARKVGTDVSVLTPRIVSGGTPADGTGVGLSTSYALIEQIQELNPNGSVAWTTSSVDAATIGVGVT